MIDQFGQLTNKMDVLKIGNTSSQNQLTQHHPLSKAKSSQNINMTRQNSIKSEKKKDIKDQQVQTDLTMISNLFQTEKQSNLIQEIEQLENQKQQQRSNSKKNSQHQLTTSSTYNFNSAGTVGLGNVIVYIYLYFIYNSPIQSTTNSNLPSPRNQQSTHQTNIFPSPSSSIHKSKMQSLKLEQEQYSTQIQNSQIKDQKNLKKRKSLKLRIYEQQEENQLNQQHRRMYTTAGTQSQTTSPREYYTPRNKTKDDDLVLNKLQQDYEDKQEEEKLFYDQIATEIPEQNEQEIIFKAINRTPGYELAQEVNDKILETMYGNLNKTPDIVEMVNQIIQKIYQQDASISQKMWQRLQSFNEILFEARFRVYEVQQIQIRQQSLYLNKRRLIKLGKPMVLPGFK